MFVIGLIYSNGSLGRNFVVDRLVEIYFGIISIVCVVGLTLLLLLAVIVVVSIWNICTIVNVSVLYHTTFFLCYHIFVIVLPDHFVIIGIIFAVVKVVLWHTTTVFYFFSLVVLVQKKQCFSFILIVLFPIVAFPVKGLQCPVCVLCHFVAFLFLYFIYDYLCSFWRYCSLFSHRKYIQLTRI